VAVASPKMATATAPDASAPVVIFFRLRVMSMAATFRHRRAEFNADRLINTQCRPHYLRAHVEVGPDAFDVKAREVPPKSVRSCSRS
jgi:hypothetical protein